MHTAFNSMYFVCVTAVCSTGKKKKYAVETQGQCSRGELQEQSSHKELQGPKYHWPDRSVVIRTRPFMMDTGLVLLHLDVTTPPSKSLTY